MLNNSLKISLTPHDSINNKTLEPINCIFETDSKESLLWVTECIKTKYIKNFSYEILEIKEDK